MLEDYTKFHGFVVSWRILWINYLYWKFDRKIVTSWGV